MPVRYSGNTERNPNLSYRVKPSYVVVLSTLVYCKYAYASEKLSRSRINTSSLSLYQVFACGSISYFRASKVRLCQRDTRMLV
jgi:hypothetical protein